MCQDLKKSKLRVLSDVSYDHLGAPFLAFLQVQDNLECLTSARPQVIYRGDITDFFTSKPHLITQMVTQAPHLGPSTSWYKSIVPKELYPSFKKLFSALQGMCHLRYLRLPADMYDVLYRRRSCDGYRASGHWSTWGFVSITEIM